jgi:hypothetical protein
MNENACKVRINSFQVVAMCVRRLNRASLSFGWKCYVGVLFCFVGQQTIMAANYQPRCLENVAMLELAERQLTVMALGQNGCASSVVL